MTPTELYAAIGFPEPCTLNKRVFKKLFLENGDLKAADKRALSDSVDAITWQFTLKPTTIPVQPFHDAEREYGEVAVLDAGLTDRRAAARIAELVHRAIPYPVLLVLFDSDGLTVSAAPKRLSRAERDRVVVEAIASTPWLDGAARSAEEAAFVASLALQGLPHTNFHALYEAWMQRLVALDCASLSRRFDITTTLPYADRRAALDACRALDREIRALRATLGAESSFAHQVKLNARIKKLEADLRRAADAL